jgi:hypothetical protein
MGILLLTHILTGKRRGNIPQIRYFGGLVELRTFPAHAALAGKLANSS